MQRKLVLTAVAAAALLAACGGGDDEWRGTLIDPSASLTTLTMAQIDGSTASSGLQALTGKAKCDVKIVSLYYNTAGVAANEMSNASGVLLVPGGSCTGAMPLIAHARGTEVSKVRTLASATDAETIALAVECPLAFILMDEKEGRHAAHRFGLKTVGVVSVLIEAKAR